MTSALKAKLNLVSILLLFCFIKKTWMILFPFLRIQYNTCLPSTLKYHLIEVGQAIYLLFFLMVDRLKLDTDISYYYGIYKFNALIFQFPFSMTITWLLISSKLSHLTLDLNFKRWWYWNQCKWKSWKLLKTIINDVQSWDTFVEF